MKQADIFRWQTHMAHAWKPFPHSRFARIPTGQESNLIQLYTDIPRQVIQGFGGAFTQSSSGIYEALNDSGKHEVLRLLFFLPTAWLTIADGFPSAPAIFLRAIIPTAMKPTRLFPPFRWSGTPALFFPLSGTLWLWNPRWNCWPPLASPAAWMKTNSDMCHGGKLKEDCYGAFAEYLIRYLQACRSENIPVRFLTCQNEPKAVQIWESCTYTAQDEQRFIRDYLSPALEQGQDWRISESLSGDHNKERSFLRARDPELRRYAQACTRYCLPLVQRRDPL